MHSSTGERVSHWIPANHQCRIPKRWIVFDCESKSRYEGNTEIQDWRMGAAIRWRHGLKRGDYMEKSTFSDAKSMWTWITSHCRAGERTVAIAHNLGYDVRVSEALEILPTLGFTLEWCNLDSSVSAMTWRSDNGTLILADSWTWLPVPLANIGADIGTAKLSMPCDRATRQSWERYCLRDCEILYCAVSDLLAFIAANDCGNWQPTGAGMAYAIWRHKFMTHKILVHDNADAIEAERAAMHCGRAEAWRHGRLEPVVWTELDMRNAYVQIAAECELPTKLKFKTGAITHAQYRQLSNQYRLLCRVSVSTDIPCVPYNTGSKTLWPIGQFTTWLWDTEVNLLLSRGQGAVIECAYIYTRAPILKSWAEWILSLTDKANESVSPVVRTWAKHCGRALIGRISLRCPQWEVYGNNPDGMTGISHGIDVVTGRLTRFMHVGNVTLAESERTEGRDSLPQVTGWIMAECRNRLWQALESAGEANVAHVDTDALLLSDVGLRQLRGCLGAEFGQAWAVKGSWRRVIVYGPRNYRAGDLRKTSGVPRKATETAPNQFTGERWSGVSTDLEAGNVTSVTVTLSTWDMTVKDPRRGDATGVPTRTVPYVVAGAGVSTSSNSATMG